MKFCPSVGQPSSQPMAFVLGCGQLMVQPPITSRLEVGNSFEARGAQRPQKRGYKLVETLVDPDSVRGITVNFIYFTSSSNFAIRKSFISFVLHYMLIDKYFRFIVSGCLRVDILELILTVVKF